MADKITPEHRSWNMSRIKGKDTKIEVKVRSWLFAKGFRFRKNDRRYPGLRMLFFRSTERLFLLTAASGIDMKAADMQQHPKQELSSGRKSLTGT